MLLMIRIRNVVMQIVAKVNSKMISSFFSCLARSQFREFQSTHDLLDFYAKGVSTSLSYNSFENKKKALGYVSSNKIGNHIAEYRYCHSSSKSHVYASRYACMIRFMVI